MEKNLQFQRKNASSNASVGREFEVWAEQYFAQAEGLDLTRNFKLSIGAGEVKKNIILIWAAITILKKY